MISPQREDAGRFISPQFLRVAALVAVLGCLVVLLVSHHAGTSRPGPEVLPKEIGVFYVYFGSETFLPVIRESIKHANGWSNVAAGYNKHVTIRDKTTISAIYAELHQRTNGGHFDEAKVRLLIAPSDCDQPLWVDSQGRLATASSVYTLRPDAFMRLRQLIHHLLPPSGASE
jgi:hypothetical protein